MRRLLIISFISIIALGCSNKRNEARLEGRIDGLKNGKLVLTKLAVNTQITVDTIKTGGDGQFSYRVKKSYRGPEFYYLYHNGNRLASLVMVPGDRVKITADTTGSDTVIEGSPESTLLMDLERELWQTTQKFEEFGKQMSNAVSSGDKRLSDELNLMLGSLYVKQKQSAIKHIYSNPRSITNLILLYHKLTPELPLFADVRDMFLFQRVYDTLQLMFPGSVYLSKLQEEIKGREQFQILNNKLLEASEKGFPEIALPDTRANIKSLSELSGKVIILSFWSVHDANQRMMNQDLLKLYDRFSLRGLEIYQVCVDVDKTAWANAVREQNLPWISVCDGLGANSSAISAFNVREVPANFVIDRTGVLVARDIFNDELERKIASLIR